MLINKTIDMARPYFKQKQKDITKFWTLAFLNLLLSAF